jgi:hypothetical protein
MAQSIIRGNDAVDSANIIQKDANGNVGIGVTPSAWASTFKSIDIQNSGISSTSVNTFFSNNSYNDGVWKYKTSTYATDYYQGNGGHIWRNAASGTAGNPITWTTAMTLDASGQLSNVSSNTVNLSSSFITNYDNGITRIGYINGTDRNINIRANTGYNTSITFTEAGVADRWTIGSMSGNGGLFFKTGSSLQTGSTAMTLDASGNLLVGADNALNPNYGISVRNVSGMVGNIITGHASGTTTGNGYAYFMYAGTTIGSIAQSGTTAVVYNTTSDHRLKENIRPANCAKFMDIKFVDYERIDGRHECGVIAHELQEVYPDLVTGEKDATEIRKVELTPAIEEVKDVDGNIITEAVEATYEEQEFPVYQQVNYMGLIARIGTVVQQQQEIINNLKERIEILEGGK